mgnify:CR=1 FL=1
MAIENQNSTANAIFGWVVIIFVALFLFSKCDSDSIVSPGDDESLTALLICQDRVKDRLKSPTSAEFASHRDSKVLKPSSDKQRYSVLSHVDAQNSFGAKIRSRFICEIEWEGQKKSQLYANWKLIDLRME